MRLVPAFALLCAVSSSPAAAAEWWWIGTSGATPNRVSTYADRQTLAKVRGDELEMWVLSIAEQANPLGIRAQAMKYHYRCDKRTLSLQGRVPYDSQGKVMPLASPAPEAFAPVAKGSIGETALSFACGRPQGIELKVENAVQHALDFFAGGPQSGAQGAQAGSQEEPKTSLGTGFFIGPNGDVLTSYHVIDGASRIGCRTRSGQMLTANVSRVSQANDLVVLKVAFRPSNYLSFAPPLSAHPGDKVFTIGYGAPNFVGINEPRFTDGTISALSGLAAENAYMQISVPVQPGNSGGPLLNEEGQVVGVIAAQAAVAEFEKVEGTLPQSINWAVKSDYALPLVGNGAAGPKRTREQAIRNAEGSLCLIVAESSE